MTTTYLTFSITNGSGALHLGAFNVLLATNILQCCCSITFPILRSKKEQGLFH